MRVESWFSERMFSFRQWVLRSFTETYPSPSLSNFLKVVRVDSVPKNTPSSNFSRIVFSSLFFKGSRLSWVLPDLVLAWAVWISRFSRPF